MIDAVHIKKNYGRRAVLKDISFHGEPGERIVIVGRNGCGKSTLLQILAGVLKPDGGDLIYDGKHPLRDSRQFTVKCGYVPQENPLMEELSVLDNLRLWGYRKRRPDAALLGQFGLGDILGEKVERLSGGMKRRVSIACAAIPHPPIMLLDEPTTALDIVYRTEIARWMELYQSRGGVIVMTTHDETEIMQATQCLVMNDGSLHETPENERMMERIVSMTQERS